MGQQRRAWLAVSAAAVVAAFLGDTFSGSEASFSFFYLIAIALGTWFGSLGWGLWLSLMSAAGWTAAYFLNGRLYSRPDILYWNVGVELVVFAGVSLALARFRAARVRERALQDELARAYERLDHEMRSVGELQKSLLPGALPALPGYAMAVHYAPSTRAGGDYYDFFELPEGKVGLWIADASGHGAPAAVLMAMTRVLLRTASGMLAFPERVLATLNRQLCRTIPSARFVTACYAVLELRSGVVDYALAGHPPPLLLGAAEGDLETLTTAAGPPLGVFEEAQFECRTTRLAPGDTLVFYTDGITEAQGVGGEMFGHDRLQQTLVDERRLAPGDMRDRLLAAIERHTGGIAPADDVTLIVLRAVAPGVAGSATAG